MARPEATSEVVGDPHRAGIAALDAAGIPFLVGGAYAMQAHLGVIFREVKDLDLFVRPRDIHAALEVLRDAGFDTDLTFPHWLGKASAGDQFIDVIFSSGNGVVTVDDEWFEHANEAELFGVKVLLCPAEEGIWARAFVMERERYDGADVAHMLRSCAGTLDWERLVARFGPHWRVLFAHLVLFGFIYPSERDRIPRWVIERFCSQLLEESVTVPPEDRVCQGTLLSRAQFLIDVQRWGYADARLKPRGHLTDEEAEIWTNAIEDPEAAGIANLPNRDARRGAQRSGVSNERR